MTPQDLIAAFETLSEAPQGVTRLRELVLQLGVRGKLVPQDPNDEPASVLLGRIEKEKARLVKEKKIRKPKVLLPVDEDEVPFEVPEGWSWSRADAVLVFVTSGSRGWAKYYSDEGPMFLRIGNLDYETTALDLANIQRVSPPANAEGARTSVEGGDVLVSITGDTGMVGLVPEDLGPAYINQHIALCRPTKLVFSGFVARLLTSPLVRAQLWDSQRGIKNSLGLDDIRCLTIPLPPLPEQHRIVARVDELMGLLDRLEAARNTREATRAAVRDSALAALRDADTPEEVEVAWSRVAERMDDLFTAPADVDPLRQTVLQLAVRGRLVPQDPTDEPASALLERVEKEKARLVKEGKIRKQKPLSPVSKAEIPFEVPQGWEWGRVDDCFYVTGGIQKSGKRRPVHNCYPYLRVANVQRGSLDLSVVERFELFEGELDRLRLEPGDLLVVEGNGSESEIGRCARWGGEIEDCVHQNHLIRCRPFEAPHEEFVLRFLNAPSGMDIMKNLSVTTSGLYNLSVGKIRQIVMPIPPLAEQHRIVAKVDELMGFLDRLQERLAAKTSTHDAFAAAAVHHLDA
jgi:type I restriction enzyme, S subunit